MEVQNRATLLRGSVTVKITTIGIDLAKAVFQVHGVDGRGKVLVRKQLKRKDVVGFFANLEPCLIGMEACGSAHHWGRTLSGLGHTVRLMAPQFVKPYVKTNKNDRNDAEADLRSGRATEHALCLDQERGDASGAGAAPSSPRIC